MQSWEFCSGLAVEWTYTDCKFDNCQDIARRFKDRDLKLKAEKSSV